MTGDFSHHKLDVLRSLLIVIAAVVAVSLSAAPAFGTQAQEITLTPEESPAATASPPTETLTPTLTVTAIPTSTVTDFPPPSPTGTPIIQTVVVPATVEVLATVMIPVTVIAPAPVMPLPTLIPAQPTPNATATPAFGWSRHESMELIKMIGRWSLRRDQNASDGAYHESASEGAKLRFPMDGDGLRVIYKAHPQGGRFALILDGLVLGVFDTWAAEEQFFMAGPFFFEAGYHVVDLVALTDPADDRSIIIDALDVFNGPPVPIIPSPTPPFEPTDTDIRREIAGLTQISQPLPQQPTPTPIPEALVSLEVVVAYDLNRNRSADANEGVQGMSVRLLAGNDNRLLASGITDERGYVRLQALTAGAVTAVVPYFGETFSVRAGRGRAQSARWTLLLDAGTQPGLIP